jgi:pyruvate dehydrogenase E2 component (dihydrolipoamide acetyltransferase)
MAENISMPKLGFDMREGVLVRWVKNEGETIAKGDVLAEIETDKATVEVESSATGVVRKLLASQGDSIPVGSTIAIIGGADEILSDGKFPDVVDSQNKEKSLVGALISSIDSEEVSQEKPSDEPNDLVKASPLARKVARESKVDLSQVRGTGPGGRIIRRDIEKVMSLTHSDQSSSHEVVTKPISAPASVPVNPISGDQIIQTTKLRQAIGRRLVESKQNLPHFYVSHEYKMDALLDLRKQINSVLGDGEKISVNDFIIKAVAYGLKEFPNLNSSMNGIEILRHGSVNVGVAVTVPGGLLTVVVKDAVSKSLRQISSEIRSMAVRARDGKVKPDDVEGSTFSTSNLGMYDVENFTAIINPPEAGILAISASREVPVVENGQLKVGNRMKCTISVDHRISDGAEAAQFMQSLAKYLEDPIRLLV